MIASRGTSRVLRVLGLAVIFLGLTYSFLTNGFAVASYNEWSAWERGSEAMVLKRIEVDLLERPASGLGLSDYVGEDLGVYDRLSPEGLSTLASTAPAEFKPYESEIGAQAYFWSFLWRDVGCSSISCLHVVSSALSAAAVIGVFLSLSLVGSPGLGWAWLISAAASPWITYAAKNLFWSPWLYFLPLIAATGLVVARTRRWRWVAAAGVFVAFVVKYLGTGYHEFTAFTMLAAALPLIAVAFKSRFADDTRRQLVNSVVILASSALAFALVIIVHAQILAGNVLTGLDQIWVNTVMRRTYGEAGDFDPAYAASLSASPVEVVWRYIWSAWSTDLLSFSVNKNGSIFSVSLGSAAFILLSLACIAIVLWRAASSDALWKRDASILVLGLAIPVVWFMAAKGYSYVHVHILFFLWYFLYVPALLFVTASFAWDHRRWLDSSARRGRGEPSQSDLEPISGR